MVENTFLTIDMMARELAEAYRDFREAPPSDAGVEADYSTVDGMSIDEGFTALEQIAARSKE